MLDEKDLQAIDEIFARRLNVILESAIMPKFNLLAEGQQTLLETMASKTTVEELEDEVQLLKAVLRSQSERIEAIEKQLA